MQQRPFRNKVVYFGASVGGNFSVMNFNKGYPKPPAPVENNWKPGFTAGLLVGIRLNEKLAFQQEYLWSRLQGKETNSATDYRFDYLSLPVLIRYTVFPRVSLLAGPQFDLLIQAKERTNGQATTTTNDTEERSIGATAGVGVSLLNNVSLSARYTHGLNHIMLKQRSSLQEFKFQSVQVSVAAIF
ncbi:porin family protein [Hymenobacter sp. HDW8]|uniref:porin family protein n=1 Tax=Hymenobacter sp. HDW8 TaxID=2714932 RepID=UPI00140B6F4A|nr:porin family protein [Hymenobacter sp. HDW8]QIL77065.1 PorT family protein [Hymenobacter sp. HDW8]